MKSIYIIPLFFILLGCHDENNPKVELQAGKYTLTDDPNDYVQHYVYDFTRNTVWSFLTTRPVTTL